MPKKSNTRAAQGSGTIRQRKDGRWEARYVVGRDPGTGKQIRKSVYGQTQKEVRKQLQEISVSLNHGVYIEPTQMTVGQWLDTWLAEYTGNVKPFTLSAYSDRVRLHIKPYIGAVRLQALTPAACQKLYNDLQKEDGTHKALSPKTIKNIHGVLHKALQQAVFLGYIPNNPTVPCTLPRLEKPDITPLENDDIAAFLKAIEGDPYETIFRVDLFTGMRQGEILGLTWDCVDFNSGTILVRQQLQKEKKKGGGYYLAPLKNDKSRLITPAPSVMDLLRQRYREQMQDHMTAGDLWDMGDLPNLVFTDAFGHHLSHCTVYKHFKRIAASIGMPDERFHDLRHSYAVASLQNGDDVKTVQENLGHATASFTLDVYGHVTEKMRRDSADRMEQFIKTVSG